MANKSAYEIVSPIMNLFDCKKRFSKSFKLRSSCLAAPFTYKQKQKIREKTVKDEPKQSDNQKLVCKKKLGGLAKVENDVTVKALPLLNLHALVKHTIAFVFNFIMAFFVFGWIS